MSNGTGTPHHSGRKDGGHRNWEDIYKGAKPDDLPWFSPDPDPDILAMLEQYAPKPGKALDLGCGPGIHSIALAKRGWEVTALDISQGAIQMAEGFAKRAGVNIHFRAVDVLAYEPLPGQFDLVHDRGFLHALDPGERERWTDLVATALHPGGLVIAKEFTFDPVNRFGPPGLSESELMNVLDERLIVLCIEKTRFSVKGHTHAALFKVACRV